ncbi:hypothetical protein Csa_008377 [Cucumis sativus]|uniref:Uncharacterized protein n=1 Tax=Cucumis sativus TaxID=3659 RepID=A0A0A0KPP8_CUCSA|nr:hypothetical protein Csa_008377 [Cucumis sativus]
MASSSIFFILLLILPLPNFTTARPFPATTMTEPSSHNTHLTTAFRFNHQIFSFLPKGPIPPSAPSKRHNSLINSAPLN